MPTSRTYSTEAIVLRQRRLGDADKIITLFTPNHGRIEVVAKGVRRTKSRLAGHVEVLSHSNLLLHRGRSLDIVSQAQMLESFRPLREDLSLVSRAYYAAELVERCTDSSMDAYPTFKLLMETLRRLIAGECRPDLVLRFFELRLLDELGYRPQTETCVHCDQPPAPETNYYSAQAGGVACSNCRAEVKISGPLSVNALKMLRVMQRVDFEDVARIGVDDSLQAELEKHLADHIAFSLDREVRSAAFLHAVQRQEHQAAIAGPPIEGDSYEERRAELDSGAYPFKNQSTIPARN